MTTEEMKNDTDVLSYLRTKNAVLDARAQEEGWTFYTLLSEDIADHYETVYEFELDMARSSYSDYHKDCHGFRPSINPEWDLETLNKKISGLTEDW